MDLLGMFFKFLISIFPILSSFFGGNKEDTAASITGCMLRVPREPSVTAPLYLSEYSGSLERVSKYQYIIPRDGDIKLRKNQLVIFSCPGRQNFLAKTPFSIYKGYCQGKSIMSINNKAIPFGQVLCEQNAQTAVKVTNRLCGRRSGRLTQIGFWVTDKDWLNLIDICQDRVQGTSLYSQHMLYGGAVQGTLTTCLRPFLSTDGIPLGVNSNECYTQIYQKTVFNMLMKASWKARKYINADSYLVRGHLSPMGDFIYPSWALATMYYINVCPQWHSINSGNWKSIEMVVRNLADRKKLVFKVVTGTHGVLSLPGIHDIPTPIYLGLNKKFPVPKFIWKVVYSEETMQGIVFIVYNNPFSKAIDGREMLCKDICVENGFGTYSWKVPSKGYVYCCSIRNFLNAVPSAPLFRTRGVLSGN